MTIPHREYVEAILRGDYERAGIPRPFLPIGDHESLATAVQQRARRPQRFPDPRQYAVALGLRLVPRAPGGFCGEATAGDIVAYRWDADPQVRGMLVLHGVGHRVLRHEAGRTNDSDAWLLTGCLGIEVSALPLVRRNPAIAMRHLPQWFVFARIIQANLCRAAEL